MKNQRRERKTMRKYFVYMDDGHDCFKCAIPAVSEKAARKYVEGNGEVVAVKDVTADFPISEGKVNEALEKAQLDRTEIDFIVRCLRMNGITDVD